MDKKFEFLKSKIVTDWDILEYFLGYCRLKDRKIVFTNGCFDILHRGHIEYLSKAAQYGDELIIGLNSDSSVRQLKGPDRPVQDEQSRAMILAALGFVSRVVLFEQETPYELIKRIQPDVLIKGGDYRPDKIVGSDIVKSRGGKVATINFVPGYSTTEIIKKMS